MREQVNERERERGEAGAKSWGDWDLQVVCVADKARRQFNLNLKSHFVNLLFNFASLEFQYVRTGKEVTEFGTSVPYRSVRTDKDRKSGFIYSNSCSNSVPHIVFGTKERVPKSVTLTPHPTPHPPRPHPVTALVIYHLLAVIAISKRH